MLDSSLSLSEMDEKERYSESGKESGKDVLDDSEREFESMKEQQRQMAVHIVRKRWEREKEEL